MHYISNIFFELELEGKAGNNLKNVLSQNPLFRQLQFLPLLYLSKEDTLIVTEIPDNFVSEGARLCLIDDARGKGSLRSWGASDLICRWAQEKGFTYDMPPMACCRNVNSKLWNFKRNIPLEGAKIVFSAEEMKKAIQNTQVKWVLKTDQGFSGRGHCIFDAYSVERAIAFGSKIWESGCGIILEPWVRRICDFSSQWNISKTGALELLGTTKCLNTEAGVYLGTETGDEEMVFGKYLPFVLQHLEYCKTYLQDIIKEGFFGNLGVDAMVYLKENVPTLYPVVEINARMTMSSAILLYHQHFRNCKVTRIYYRIDNSENKNLLPNISNRKLIVETISKENI